RIQSFQIVEHADHDWPGADRLQSAARVFRCYALRLLQPCRAFLVGKNLPMRKGVNEERRVDGLVARQEMSWSSDAFERHPGRRAPLAPPPARLADRHI